MAIKINFVVRLQHWMDSVPGQTFLNYAYSWGAAIVILGALFKLTHLPGGNIMLFIGMGTEVVVFTLSAFDRPFDKTEVGKELPHDYETDEEIAARLGLTDDEDDEEEENETEDLDNATPAVQPQVAGCVPPASPTIIIGGNGAPASAGAANAAAAANVAATDPVELSPEMEEATQTYIGKLQALADTFTKVDEQSARLAKDSVEMENLNRTLTGINRVYELHLKSISLQVGTIDQINSQTQMLARQIEELNGVYARMIQALTVNMRGTAPAQPSAQQPAQPYAQQPLQPSAQQPGQPMV